MPDIHYYFADVELTKKSGISADSSHNGFVFQLDLDGIGQAAGLDGFATSIAEFYNGSHGHTAINEWMGISLSAETEANSITWYEISAHLNGSRHGAPVRQSLWTLSGTAGTALPDEVAVVVTYQRAYNTDAEFGIGIRPRARDRGRVYVGPLGQNGVQTDGTTGEAFVTADFITALCHAGADLVTNSASQWLQWSRANASVAPVTNGWVDDRFDSQRRRQQAARVKSLW